MSKLKIKGKTVSKKNQIHKLTQWDIDALEFTDPEETIIEGNPPIKFYRISLLTQNYNLDSSLSFKNGKKTKSNTIGEALFLLPKSFCFGVTENVSKDSNKVTGHSVSISMWNKDNPTEEEIANTNVLEKIIEKCKNHLINIKKDLKKPKLELNDLKSMDKLLYFKEDENGERLQGKGPTMSPKLIEYQERVDKNGKVIKNYNMATVFYGEEKDENGDNIEEDPLIYLSTKEQKKYFYIEPVIKLDSIFFGAKTINIQVKITEAYTYKLQQSQNRLLKSIPNQRTLFNDTINNPLINYDSKNEIENKNDQNNDEDEDQDELEM